MIGEYYSPSEANIYIMDFGAKTLKFFEKMNHVGGIVVADEDEKLRNLYKLLRTEVLNRKNKLLDVGVSSLDSYIEAGFKDLPRIIVLIDNFIVYNELYGSEYESEFLFLCREGSTLGISFVVTNSQTTGFGYRYMSNFANRLALPCNDSGEYGNLFDRCRTEPKNVPGRMLFSFQKEIFELQTYLAFDGEKEKDRTEAIHAFTEIVNSKNENAVAKAIPSIPDLLTMEYLERNYELPSEMYNYPIALDYANVDLVCVNLRIINELCIVGKNSVTRLKVINTLLSLIENNIDEQPVKTYIIDNVARPLKSHSENVEQYTIDYSEIGTVFDDVIDELEERHKTLMEDGLEGLEKYPLILVIINNNDVIEYISKTDDLKKIYESMNKQYKSLKTTIIFSNIDDVAINYNSPELFKRFKESQNAIVTCNIKELKFYEIPTNIIRESRPLGHNDAYLLNGNDNISRIKYVEVD